MRFVWQGLLALARQIGRVQTWLLLTLIYVVFISPVALILKCAQDPLGLRTPVRRRPPRSPQPPRDPWEWARSQF